MRMFRFFICENIFWVYLLLSRCLASPRIVPTIQLVSWPHCSVRAFIFLHSFCKRSVQKCGNFCWRYSASEFFSDIIFFAIFVRVFVCAASEWSECGFSFSMPEPWMHASVHLWILKWQREKKFFAEHEQLCHLFRSNRFDWQQKQSIRFHEKNMPFFWFLFSLESRVYTRKSLWSIGIIRIFSACASGRRDFFISRNRNKSIWGAFL